MMGVVLLALTLKPPRPVTDEELLEFSRQNPGLQFERTAAGELVVTPTGAASGRRELALGAQLARWAEERREGIAFGSSAGFRMPDGAILSPDASWVHRDRWAGLTSEEREGFAPLCPDAVFEIASRSDSLATLRAKMRTYLDYGAQVGVWIGPYSRTVEIYRPDDSPQMVQNPATVQLGPALPGFVLDVRPIFEV
jgi:Uma2 family endonuclease